MFFAYALEREEPRWLWAWAISSLAFTTHYFAVVLIVPEAAWLLLRGPRARTLIASAAMGAAGLVVLLLAGVNQQQDKVARDPPARPRRPRRSRSRSTSWSD